MVSRGRSSKQASEQSAVEQPAGGRRQWAADRALRPAMRSPGRPAPSRAIERSFWRLIAGGATTEDAAAVVGVSTPVASRWFRHAGGMPPINLAEPPGRYLSFVEREEIALLVAQSHGVREIARQVGRDPSTISRELRRNAATRASQRGYRAGACPVEGAAGGQAPEGGEARHAPAASGLRRAAPVRRRARRPRPASAWAERVVGGPPTRASARPPLGQRVEPGADQPSPAGRVPR